MLARVRNGREGKWRPAFHEGSEAQAEEEVPAAEGLVYSLGDAKNLRLTLAAKRGVNGGLVQFAEAVVLGTEGMAKMTCHKDGRQK
jgi:hypothetical protein